MRFASTVVLLTFRLYPPFTYNILKLRTPCPDMEGGIIMGGRWSRERINAWYDGHPWLIGCNYVPAITLHNIELWQDDTREEVMISVDRELTLLRETRMNSIRMFMPFQAWYFERELFFKKLDELLLLLEKYEITLMPVLFNDCAPLKGQVRYSLRRWGKDGSPMISGIMGKGGESVYRGNAENGLDFI